MTAEAAAGRRYLIAAGVSAYRDGGIDDLPEAVTDAERLWRLLEPLGYTRVLQEISVNPNRAMLTEGIEDWALESGLGPQDVVVVYFAGHGVCDVNREHFLYCADTRPGRLAGAVPSADLARPLVAGPLGSLLVVLDTCYAQAGTSDTVQLAAELAHTQRERSGRWQLATARARETAGDGAFIDALGKVLADHRTGPTQEFLGVREVTERVNQHFAQSGLRQRVRWSLANSDGHDPFFPNPDYLPGLPADGLDVAAVQRLRARGASHFGPRGRGVEHTGERGDYFTGRTAALSALAAFLKAGHHDRKARVITGDPGSGKSALLGRVWALSAPDHPAHQPGSGYDPATVPPPAPGLIALHARRSVLERLAGDLADALQAPATDVEGLPAVLAACTEPVTVLVDALDEAGTSGDSAEARRIARDLLLPLSALPQVRLVIGTRRPVIDALGPAVEVIDLDREPYRHTDDLTHYARARLLDAADPDSRSPYRDHPAEAQKVAEGVAERAGDSFLAAMMTARALVHGQIAVDTSRPGWQRDLPDDAKSAFDTYLQRLGPWRPTAERLLRPLAYAQGAGLPWSTVWAAVAERLSGMRCPAEDLRELQEKAGAYITVDTDAHGGAVYRLFHETMAEHLRTTGRISDDHRAITEALLELVPADASGQRDWPAAHPYIRDHLATHAAAGGLLDPLLDDTEFLVHATPQPLLRALDHTHTTTGRALAAAYRTSGRLHATTGPTGRRTVLAIDTARYRLTDTARALSRPLPWRPRWATGNLVHPALRAILNGHTRPVGTVAIGQLDDRPIAVSCGQDATVRVWDLMDGTQHALLTGHTDWVRALATGRADGRAIAVTGGNDATVRVWDLADGTERFTLTGHARKVNAVALGQLDGRPIAVTGSNDLTLRVWDLATGTQLAVLTGHTGSVNTLALGQLAGRPVAVSGSHDTTVGVWDLAAGTQLAVLTGHTGSVNALAVGHADGRPIAVTGSNDLTARVWELTDGTQRAVLTGHTGPVNTLAVGEADGRPVAVTGSRDAVRVWDLAAGTERATLTGHTGPVLTAAVGQVAGRPVAVTGSHDAVRVWDLTQGTERATLTGHAGSVFAAAVGEIAGRPVAVTGSRDRTVRVWDLTEDTERATLTGHAGPVFTAAVGQVDGRPVAITGSHDETVRIWDVARGTAHATLTGHTGPVCAAAFGQLDGRPVAITGSQDATVRIWDLAHGEHRTFQTAQFDPVFAVAFGHIGGRPVAITGNRDAGVRLWDLPEGTERPSFTHSAGPVLAIAYGEITGHPVAVTGGRDGAVRIWDLARGSEHATLTGHTGPVIAVAIGEIDGRPVAVTGGQDGTVRIWDLAQSTEHAVLNGHTDPVFAVAIGEVHGRPVAVTGGQGRTLRLWDLTLYRETDTLLLPLPCRAVAVAGDALVLGMEHEVVVLEKAARGRPAQDPWFG